MTDTAQTVMIGAALGGAFGWLHTQGSFPGAMEIGATLQKPGMWLLITLYFCIGWAILYLFLKPQNEAGIAAWIGMGLAWNAF